MLPDYSITPIFSGKFKTEVAIFSISIIQDLKVRQNVCVTVPAQILNGKNLVWMLKF